MRWSSLKLILKGVEDMAENERGGIFGCGGSQWIWIVVIIVVIILIFPCIFRQEQGEGYYKE